MKTQRIYKRTLDGKEYLFTKVFLKEGTAEYNVLKKLGQKKPYHLKLITNKCTN